MILYGENQPRKQIHYQTIKQMHPEIIYHVSSFCGRKTKARLARVSKMFNVNVHTTFLQEHWNPFRDGMKQWLIVIGLRQ